MELIFMGTPDFSVGVLEALAKAGHKINLVVSQPDKPKGRGHEMQPTAVKEAAEKLGLPVYQPVRVKSPEAVEKILSTPADAIVVVAFGQLIPKSILEAKKYGCINVHASLLPKYRGAAPIQWAVIDGEEESGVTIMQMDEGLDTGDMLLQKKIRLDKDETGGSLFDRLSDLGAQAAVEALEKLEKGELTAIAQGETTTEYAKMLTRDMGKIDFNKSAVEIERLVRGLSPWPSTFTHLGKKMLKIWKTEVVEESLDMLEGIRIGEVVTTKDRFFVGTGDGVLEVKELQLEGKKRMDSAAFLRGAKVEPGTILGA